MSIESKNLYALLGNDSDGEEKPVVPVKTVDKAPSRTTKRNVEPQAPQAPLRTGGNRRGGPGGNEGAFRDRAAGRDRNQGRTTDETPRDGPRGGYGARGRGGRGGRFPRERDDRHPNKSGVTGSEKQAAQSWGATEGNAELKDEQAAEAMAETEHKDEQPEAAAAEETAAEEAEPEDKSISYAEYIVQQAEKKLNFESELNVRAANEGSKVDKKWASAKPLEKADDEYVTGTYGKKQRDRERKVKQTVDFDPRFVEAERPRGGPRGGRGGPRGGGRGGSERGRGGPSRGGRGASSAAINTSDESAFPTLGGK